MSALRERELLDEFIADLIDEIWSECEEELDVYFRCLDRDRDGCEGALIEAIARCVR